MDKYNSLFPRRIYFLFIIVLYGFSYGQLKQEDLFNMTLEELMSVKVNVGTLTGIEQGKFPGVMRIITSEEIALTSARNILDLIEIYIPGATHLTHYQGQRLGMRGNLSDQNYSYLVMVNGKSVNLNANYGAMFELQDKDLTGIEKIEIISGAGSAVLGPGATAGVINIITQSAKQQGMVLNYHRNLNYRYSGMSFQLSDVQSDFNYYLSGSIYQSLGLENTEYWYIDRAQKFSDNKSYGWGYMTPYWGNYGLGTDAPAYYDDYLKTPEVKLHFDFNWGDFLNFWSRYSTYNNTLMTQESESAEGPQFSGHLAKYFASELSANYQKNQNFVWTNKLGFRSANIRHINLYQGEQLSVNHIAQRGNSFSENDFSFSSLIKYNFNEKYKFAVGGEAVYQYYGPEWGMDDNSFILSFQAPIRFAVKDTTSGFYRYYGNPIANVVKEDIDGHMSSLFGEANLKFHPLFQALISARADKHQYSDPVLSPRLAFISQWNDKNMTEIIIERAVRMPMFTDLYAQHYLGGENAKPEIMTGFECKYAFQPNKQMLWKSNFYHYSIDQISWINENLFSDNIGTFKLFGFESEFQYRKGFIDAGMNYSYIHQTDWEPELSQTAWISGAEGEVIPIENNGDNRINNLPAQAMKFFMIYTHQPRLTFHLNGRLMWDYQQKDMLDRFEKAHQIYGNSEMIRIMDQIRIDLEDRGYTKPSFTLNTSILWKIKRTDFDIGFRLYALNLISYNNLRYIFQFWESGNLRQYPRQCGFIKEPLTIGLNFELKI